MSEITAGEAPVERARRTGVGDVLLDVRDLRTHFQVMDGTVKAVDGVSFSVRRGGTPGDRRRVRARARA